MSTQPQRIPGKYGKTEATPLASDRLFCALRAVASISVPANFGNYAGVSYPMFGNDQYGDCVWAGGGHEEELWTRYSLGAPATFTDADILAAYTAVTGFNPNVPSTDTGTNVHDALTYRQKTGIKDAAGRYHKLGAFASIEPDNLTHLAESTYVFGATGIGIQVPETAQTQFAAGQPWTYVRGAQIEGGHYVPVVGRSAGFFIVVTWGALQRVTTSFLTHYCDESFALLSPEWLKAGKSPEGLDLSELQADLSVV